MKAWAVAAAGLLLNSGVLPAQGSAVIDEATFTITRKGAPVGRESFRITRSPGPGGQVFKAVASGAFGEGRNQSTLTTDSTGGPVSYESVLSIRAQVIERLQGRGRPERFTVMVQTKGGEAVNEYVVRAGTVVLEADTYYQYYFAARAGGEVSVLAPRMGRQEALKVEDMGVEELAIGREKLSARHLSLVDAAGGRRDVWVDRVGRLLRISLPADGLVATRDDPPRQTTP